MEEMKPSPNIVFRPGEYEQEMNQLLEDGTYQHRTDLLHAALWHLLRGPARFSPDLISRLNSLATERKCSVSDLLERLIEAHEKDL